MNWKVLFAGLIYAIAFSFLMLYCKQDEFSSVFLFFSGCFFAYGFIFYQRKHVRLGWMIAFGLALRVLTVFIFPNLSDDIYRFFWDGQLWIQGIHPFDFTPTQLYNSAKLPKELLEVYPQLNSQEYYTIYPPVLQFIFFTAASIGKTVGGTALVMKILYVLIDLLAVFGLIKLLDHFGKDKKLALLYFLNPLIIVELVGNIHAEVIMVFSLIWMAYFLVKEKYWIAGIFYALAIASKILPFLLGPLLLFYLIKKKAWFPFFAISGVLVLTSFVLMLYGSDIAHLLDSVDLYFRSFEFNASFYYIGRWLGYLNRGYNMIGFFGPLLAVFSLFLILKESLKVNDNPEKQLLLTILPMLFVIYLLLSTTIHPWYLAVPIAFAVFNKNYWIMIVFWSYLIMLSYSAYDTNPVKEHTVFLMLEYGLLLSIVIYGSVRGQIKSDTH